MARDSLTLMCSGIISLGTGWAESAKFSADPLYSAMLTPVRAITVPANRYEKIHGHLAYANAQLGAEQGASGFAHSEQRPNCAHAIEYKRSTARWCPERSVQITLLFGRIGLSCSDQATELTLSVPLSNTRRDTAGTQSSMLKHRGSIDKL